MIINNISQHLQQIFIEYLQYTWFQNGDPSIYWTTMIQVSSYTDFTNKLFYPFHDFWSYHDGSHLQPNKSKFKELSAMFKVMASNRGEVGISTHTYLVPDKKVPHIHPKSIRT